MKVQFDQSTTAQLSWEEKLLCSGSVDEGTILPIKNVTTVIPFPVLCDKGTNELIWNPPNACENRAT